MTKPAIALGVAAIIVVAAAIASCEKVQCHRRAKNALLASTYALVPDRASYAAWRMCDRP